MQEFLSILYPILLTFLTGLLTFVGKEVLDFVVAKVGIIKYTKGKAVAWDVWNVIEEHFRVSQIIGDTVQAKITMFETLIKQKVPGITDANIKLFRQAIAGEFNKDKPLIIKDIEDPVIIVTPIIKYVTPDGTELKPITNIATQ